VTTDQTRPADRKLRGLLLELAQTRTPDYLEAAIEQASARSQRPAWTFLERWIPMELVTSRVSMTRLPWRQLGVLALIALLVAGALVVYVGSRIQRSPAPPFGPAGNGLIALGRDGDLFVVDPATGRETLLVGGPESDEWIGFTPDGTRGIFLRWGPDNGAVTAAGIGSVQLNGGAKPVLMGKDVLHGNDSIELAPNGRDVAFATFDWGTPNIHINVGSLDGTSFRVFENVPVADYGGLAFLAPDGHELVFVAPNANAHTHDIRALDLATGTTRLIVETSRTTDIFGNLSASPDGKRIAYALADSSGAISVHVVGTDGIGDRVVGHAAGATFEAWPQWDPQGRRLLLERDTGAGGVRPVIVDLGGGPDVVVATTISENGAGKAWAPDGSAILAQRTAANGNQLQQELWNVTTGAVTPVGWPSRSAPAWQRTGR